MEEHAMSSRGLCFFKTFFLPQTVSHVPVSLRLSGSERKKIYSTCRLYKEKRKTRQKMKKKNVVGMTS